MQLFVTLIRDLFVDSWSALYQVFSILVNFLRQLCIQRRIPERIRRLSKDPCVSIQRPEIKRPDPLIYSQSYLMEQGLAVTWDNPDIELRRNGVSVPSEKLELNTDYEIIGRVWNNSTEAPVIQLPVAFSVLSFGVGTLEQPLGVSKVDLGVKGGSNHPAFATTSWRTPNTPGHYCLQAKLQWKDDLNQKNNLGQENTLVGVIGSPAKFQFSLRNNDSVARQFRFEIDSYTLPTPITCPQRDAPEQPQTTGLLRLQQVRERHDRQNFPLPEGWRVSFNTSQPLLQSGAEIVIDVSAEAPTGFRGRQPINVNVFHEEGFFGGVTLYVVDQ